MADEKNPLSGIIKSLNDARYVPALFGVLLVGIILFSPKDGLAEDARRKALAAMCIFTIGFAIVGFVHSQLAWREINRATHAALGPDHEAERAKYAPLPMSTLYVIIAVYAAIGFLAIGCFLVWLR